MSRPFDSKINKKKLTPFSIYFLSVLGLLVFLYGFFPLKYSSNSKPKNDIENQRFKPRYIDRLAFIVIDALRYDFVMPDSGQNYMPFVLSSIISNKSCYMVTKAHSPTVTLPRLKAITSGSISTYIDVVLNFMTPAFEDENFIQLAVTNGLKLVFYGDDTWLKLFPNSFIRSEGTNSFFTYDYVEVDDNVTRHIDDEFKKNDWDIIILHYLGLDHIGHTEGPNSQLVRPKLLEMDNIVKRFNDHFKKLEKHKNLRTMLIVTGDHGMKDSGSHGGVTYPEVTVPLVSVGKPCTVLSGWQEKQMPLQIDLASTLSTLFGLPIPANNMGKIIPGLLHNMQREDILKNLEINRMGLSRLITSSHEDSIKTEFDAWILNKNENEKLAIHLTKKYYKILNQMSQDLVSSKSDFKLFFLITGMTLLWICLISLLYDASIHWPKPQSCIHWFFLIATILHGVSLFSSSFIEEEHQTWYFFWATFCIFTCLESLNWFVKKKSTLDFPYVLSWFVLAMMHRVLRKLNQTGDKWASLPDIKFYLHSEEGQPWLLFLFLLGVGIVFYCALSEGCSFLQMATYGISLLSIIGYRIATRNFKLKFLNLYPSSRGLSEVFVFWVSTSFFTIQTYYKKKNFYLVWLALNSLLLRPHNIILLPIQVFISKKLHKLFHKSVVWNCTAHLWLGNVFYFYQGNGNSLSNVDVAAGFVGTDTYNPIYAGVMITAHTFSFHILSYILSPKSDLVLASLRIIPLTLYCSMVTFQLNHLFIWSVFSPKLLYESSVTVLFLLLMILNHLLNFWELPVR